MELQPLFDLAGSLVLLASGLLTVVRPQIFAALTHLALPDARAQAEMRVNFGGFVAAVGLAAILVNQPAAYAVIGAGWLGAALVRVAALVWDRPRFDLTYALLLLGEVLFAVLMLLG
jgi:hypothetical protein